ncbi:MAG: diaminopimelate epimerase [Syntrophobacteraceae bacterium]
MTQPLLDSSERIRFMKMTGSGNDFIIIDNRSQGIEKERGRELARRACRRKVSVGADGLILIENDSQADFRWVFFNADGSEAEMCGNGARCAARFAYLNGIVDKTLISFRTLAGIIHAEIKGERVKVLMTQPHGLETDFCVDAVEGAPCLHFVNTGVPHVVWFVGSAGELENIDVFDRGRTLRFHPRFQPAGTNANFAFVIDPGNIAIRTYERGVEAETLACGTGSIACALTAAAKGLVESPVEVLTRSGETLVIHFEKAVREGKIEFSSVCLEGDAKVVYDAELRDETLRR